VSGARHAYLNARVSIFAGRLLPAERFEALVAQEGFESPEWGDVGTFLAPDGPDPVRLEQTLLSRIWNDFQVLARAARPEERALLAYGFHWFELMNLKALIRGKLSGLPEKIIREQILDLGPFASLPVDDLLRSEDPAEMLRRLETTVYSDIARQARRAYEDHKDLFTVEATIDRRYFAELLARVRMIGGTEQAAVHELVGKVLDRFNLTWLLRYRFSYNLPPAEAYYLLAPAGRQLSAERLLALAQLGSLEEILNALPQEMKDLLTGVASISEADNRLDGIMLDAAGRALKNAAHPVARAFAYLIVRDGEMRRLMAIVKGRRMGLPADLVRFAARLEVA
jgi:V/A-type H+-transporting ATPase subunit C